MMESIFHIHQTREPTFSPDSLRSLSIGSPVFSKFFNGTPDSLPGRSKLSIERRSIETRTEYSPNKKIKVDVIEEARQAHIKINSTKPILSDLILSPKQLQMKREVSMLGSYFKKVLSWNDEEVVANKDTEEKLKTIAIPDDSYVHMGLTRSSVVTLSNYSKELRAKAQEVMLGGRKNVAFVNKVRILEIPLRKNVSKQIRSKMFYSRSQFVRMISNNLKEVELEARRKYKLQRKKSYLQRSTNSK